MGREGAGDAPHRHPGPGPRAAAAARDRTRRAAGTPAATSAATAARPSAASTRNWQKQAKRLAAGQRRRSSPALNEDLAATAVWGTQQIALYGRASQGRRVRHLVRQGPRRGPLRRRAAPRQQRRHLAARRRARARRRRPLRQVLHRHQRLRIRLRRPRDADARPRRRGGGARLRPEGPGDVALRRPLGRHEMRGRDHGRRRHPPPRPRRLRHARPGRLPPAARRRPHPPRRPRPSPRKPACAR